MFVMLWVWGAQPTNLLIFGSLVRAVDAFTQYGAGVWWMDMCVWQHSCVVHFLPFLLAPPPALTTTSPAPHTSPHTSLLFMCL